MPKVDEFEQKCLEMSNDTLISEEINQRRSIASFAASLSLTTAVTMGTAGAASPLTVPLGGWKVYKINLHHKKLKTVRAELAKRNLTPVEKRKRDVFIPASVTMVTYITTLGIADAFDIVPDTAQNAFQAPVADLVGSDTTALSESANHFQVEHFNSRHGNGMLTADRHFWLQKLLHLSLRKQINPIIMVRRRHTTIHPQSTHPREQKDYRRKNLRI
ncbi:hypothetical protein FRC19_010195 [Serendipita sp. 401]|nr:hypothetical protein FRC19_010195 [Serendipita sp. 401]